MRSHDQIQDVIVAVEATLVVGADIEHLREFECVFFIHAQDSTHKDQHTARNWAFLDILTADLVLYSLEAEGFDFVFDLGESFVEASAVGHGTAFVVEIE